ncbi:hypothetical protein [Methanobrevibacter ruminantium]|nr:hypothetical protein [Methanobrevibacter ruminantium]
MKNHAISRKEFKERRIDMELNSKHYTIILIIAIIIAVIMTYMTGIKNPIIIGLCILAIIVILANLYLTKLKK